MFVVVPDNDGVLRGYELVAEMGMSELSTTVSLVDRIIR